MSRSKIFFEYRSNLSWSVMNIPWQNNYALPETDKIWSAACELSIKQPLKYFDYLLQVNRRLPVQKEFEMSIYRNTWTFVYNHNWHSKLLLSKIPTRVLCYGKLVEICIQPVQIRQKRIKATQNGCNLWPSKDFIQQFYHIHDTIIIYIDPFEPSDSARATLYYFELILDHFQLPMYNI